MSKIFFTDLCRAYSVDEPVSQKPECNHIRGVCISNTTQSAHQNPMRTQHVVRFSPSSNATLAKEKFRNKPKSKSCVRNSVSTKSTRDSQDSKISADLVVNVKSTTTFQKCQHLEDQREFETRANTSRNSCRRSCPVVMAPRLNVSAQNVNSCSPKTCSCVSTVSSKNSARSSARTRSTLHVSNSAAQTVKEAACDSKIVEKLKNELDIVKSQLEQITINKQDDSSSTDRSPDSVKQVYQLRSENRQLRKQLETKKKLYKTSLSELEKAKDILNDYDKRVSLLHQQAVKSSKVMKQSKEKFCRCIEEKETIIAGLKENKEELLKTIRDKTSQFENFCKEIKNLQAKFCEGGDQINNENICQCIREMSNNLDAVLDNSRKYKDEVESLKKKIEEHNCLNCLKLENKLKKQKLKFEGVFKRFESNERMLKEQIFELTDKLKNNPEVAKLKEECDEHRRKLSEFEDLTERYKKVEEECKCYCDTIESNEKKFERDREELRKLVNELTSVVRENKLTLLQLSKINREQETMLISQNAFLLQKEEQIKYAESEIEMLQKMSKELEVELREIKGVMSGPCKRAECKNAWNEIKELRQALNVEKDNKLVKEKIIEDQSQTIMHLRSQVQESIEELRRAREESSIAEEEINKINDNLMRKHQELEKELDEKGRLMQKLKKLEYQKSMLSNEMSDLEILLEHYAQSKHYDERQQQAIFDLKKQVSYQKREWEAQKVHLAEEKEMAVKAAKFATQKLLDTVADFQKQVNAQRKVQIMLTKMLHDKEEELAVVKEKISSINNIVSESTIGGREYTLDELYRHKINGSSRPSTTPGTYSTGTNWSGSSPKFKDKPGKSELQQVFEIITKTDDVPMREFSK